jgi:DNA-binding LytR/AlgR family response regulator
MPGLTGLELATVLSPVRVRPAVVFVTAHEEHAVEAFELDAVDYVLKPVREDRLRAAVRRWRSGERGATTTSRRRHPGRARRRHPGFGPALRGGP